MLQIKHYKNFKGYENGWQITVKRLVKFSSYVLLFCIEMFLLLAVTSYIQLESYMIDTGEAISDALRDVPQTN
jgi:hypothetical protein